MSNDLINKKTKSQISDDMNANRENHFALSAQNNDKFFKDKATGLETYLATYEQISVIENVARWVDRKKSANEGAPLIFKDDQEKIKYQNTLVDGYGLPREVADTASNATTEREAMLIVEQGLDEMSRMEDMGDNPKISAVSAFGVGTGDIVTGNIAVGGVMKGLRLGAAGAKASARAITNNSRAKTVKKQIAANSVKLKKQRAKAVAGVTKDPKGKVILLNQDAKDYAQNLAESYLYAYGSTIGNQISEPEVLTDMGLDFLTLSFIKGMQRAGTAITTPRTKTTIDPVTKETKTETVMETESMDPNGESPLAPINPKQEVERIIDNYNLEETMAAVDYSKKELADLLDKDDVLLDQAIIELEAKILELEESIKRKTGEDTDFDLLEVNSGNEELAAKALERKLDQDIEAKKNDYAEKSELEIIQEKHAELKDIGIGTTASKNRKSFNKKALELGLDSPTSKKAYGIFQDIEIARASIKAKNLSRKVKQVGKSVGSRTASLTKTDVAPINIALHKAKKLDESVNPDLKEILQGQVEDRAKGKQALDGLKKAKEDLEITRKYNDDLPDDYRHRSANMKYNEVKAMYERYANAELDSELPKISITPLNTISMRDKARLNGDKQFANWLDDHILLEPNGNVKRKLKDFSAEELKALVNEKPSNTVTDDIDFVILPSGDILKKYDDPVIRGYGTLVAGTRDNADGTINANSAGVYKAQYLNAGREKMANILFEGFEEFMKEKGEKVGFFKRVFFQFLPEYKIWSSGVAKISHSSKSSEFNPNDFTPSMLDTAKDIEDFVGELKADYIRAGWQDDAWDLFIDANTGNPSSVLSRVLDKDVVMKLDTFFSGEEMKKIYLNAQTAITAAMPSWTISSALSRIKADKIEVDPDDLAKLKQFKKEYTTKNGKTMPHDEAHELIDILERNNINTFTKVVAETYIRNNIYRAQRPDHEVKLDIDGAMDEILNGFPEMVKSLGIKVDPRDVRELSEALKTQASRTGVKGGNVNQSKKRLPMDPTVTTRVTKRNLDGTTSEEDFSLLDLMSNDIGSILEHQVLDASNKYGLAKVGLNSMDKFNAATETARQAAAKITDKLKKSIVNDAINKIYNDLTGTPQYNQQTALHQVSRISRKINFLKLGKLWLNMGAESGSHTQIITASKGLGKNPLIFFLETYKNVLFAAKKDKVLNDALTAMGGSVSTTYDKLMMQADNGVEAFSTSTKPAWWNNLESRVSNTLDGAENASNYIQAAMVKTFKEVDRQMRIGVSKHYIQNMIGIAKNGGMKSLDPDSLKRALDFGYNDLFFEQLTKHIDNGNIKINKKGILVDIDVDGMRNSDRAFFDEFTALNTRTVEAVIMTQRVDNVPPFVLGEVYNLTSQFKTFMIASYSSGLRYNLSKKDMYTANYLLWSYTMGSLTYGLSEALDGRAENLTPENILLSGLRRGAPFGMVATVIDSASGAVGGEPVFTKFGSTYGGNIFDGNNIPFINIANSLSEITRETGLMVQGEASIANVMQTASGTLIPNFHGTKYTLDHLEDD